MIGAIASATDILTYFRRNTLKYTHGEHATQEIEEFKNFIVDNASKLSLKMIGYLRLVNALDPFVNKSMLYYIMFLELCNFKFT